MLRQMARMSNGQQYLESAKLHLLMMVEKYCLGVLSGHGRRSRERGRYRDARPRNTKKTTAIHFMISCFSGTDLPAPDVECNERL
jgi:hypothetical protein